MQELFLLFILTLLLIIPARAEEMQVPHGTTVEIMCTGSDILVPVWSVNGTKLFGDNEFPNMERKEEFSSQQEFVSRLCVNVDMALHQGISLQCTVGDTTHIYVSLNVTAQLFSPENVIVSYHSSSEVLIQWSPPSYIVTDEFITVEIEFGITHYTVYTTSTSGQTVTHVTNTTGNSTELLFSGLPGEDMNKCREYMLEVTASNGMAGEGKRSKPSTVTLPRGCSDASQSYSAAAPTPTGTTQQPTNQTSGKVGPIVGTVVAAILAVTIVGAIVGLVVFFMNKRHRKHKTVPGTEASVEDNEYVERIPSSPPPQHSPQTSESSVYSEPSNQQGASARPTTQTVANSNQHEHEPEQQYANPQEVSTAEQDEDPPPLPERTDHYADLAFSGPRPGPTMTEEVAYTTVAEHLQ